MLLQKSIQFVPGLKSQRLPKFCFGQPPALVLLKSQNFQHAARDIAAGGVQASRKVVWNLYRHIHKLNLAPIHGLVKDHRADGLPVLET